MQMPTQQRLRAFLGKQVKKCDRIAFLSAFIIGVFIHIFMFNNYLLNHDGLFYQFSDNELTSSGRWFLFVPSALSGDMSVPWINGVLAIFALSLACVFIVRLLRIERPFWVVLTAAVIVTFPVLADTFAYMFVADAFMIALLLSVLGVYLTDRRRFGFLPGAVLLALSMGCYQAYFCFAFGLVYIRGMQLLLDEKQSAKELWRKAARFLLALVLGLALYYVAMKAALAVRGTALVEYQGIDKAFAFSLKDFLFRALYAYLGFRRTILSNSPIFATAVQRGALALACGISAAASLLLLRERGIRRAGRWIAVLFMLMAMPLAFNAIYLMGAALLHEVMLYAMCLPFVLAIALVQAFVVENGAAATIWNWAKLAAYYCVAVIGILVSVLGAFYANRAYLSLDMTNKTATAVVNRLICRIEEVPGYTPETPVCFVGRMMYGNYDIDVDDAYAKASASLAFEEGVPMRLIGSPGDIVRAARHWLGAEVTLAEQDARQAIENDPRVRNMPIYPESGSLLMLDGVLVVRLSE